MATAHIDPAPPDALALAAANAASTLATPDVYRLQTRLLAAAILLDEAANPGRVYTEADLADLAGLTRHQARQAVAELVSPEGLLERGWDTSGRRPTPRYRVLQP